MDNFNFQEVYLEITSDYNGLFKNVHKFSSYINHLLNKRTSSQFYLETIHNGIIYIYKNLELMEALNTPLRKSQLRQILDSDMNGAALFLRDVVTEKRFPKEGIYVKFKIHAHSQQIRRALTGLSRYFNSYRTSEVKAFEGGSNAILIHFTTFHSLNLYAQRLGILLKEILETHP